MGFWTFSCLLFIANVSKMKEKGCSDENPPPLFPFSLLSFLQFIWQLHSSLPTKKKTKPRNKNPKQKTKTKTTKPNCSYLHLLVPIFCFICRCVKLPSPDLIVYPFLTDDDGGCSDRDMDILT